MDIDKMLAKAFYTDSPKDFSMIVESMKRKASKGLLESTSEEIDEKVNDIFKRDEEYSLLEEEADEAIKKFSYLDRENKTPKVNINIWGRPYSLDVRYDCFDDEEVTDSQKRALKSFLENRKIIDDSKESIENYIKRMYKLQKVDNIFKYIYPQYIYIKRNTPIAVIMCRCKNYDDGIGIYFVNGKTIIKSQDYIL